MAHRSPTAPARCWLVLAASLTGCTALVDSSRSFGGQSAPHDNDARPPGADTGPALVAPAYEEVAYLKSDHPERLGAFGYPVVLSGETVLVGSAGASVAQFRHAGRGYVFDPAGSAWSDPTALGSPHPERDGGVPNVILPTLGARPPGISLAISGDTLVLGVAAEDGERNGAVLEDAGAVHVFQRTAGAWTHTQRLTAHDPRALDAFGLVVAIQGDTIAVAAPWNDGPSTGDGGVVMENSGAVYVFERGERGFDETQVLRASVLGKEDLFGAALALDRSLLAVGVPLEPGSGSGPGANPQRREGLYAGAVYTFTRAQAGGVWSSDHYVKPDATGQSDFFGMSVAISGSTLIVGAPTLARQGSVHLFERAANGWVESGPALVPGTAGGAQLFGSAVAVASDVLVVGTPGDTSTARRVDGDAAAVDPRGRSTGAAHVYFRKGASWEHAAYLKAPNAAAGDLFGLSVAASDTLVAVGAPAESGLSPTPETPSGDAGTVWAGAAYLFRRTTP